MASSRRNSSTSASIPNSARFLKSYGTDPPVLAVGAAGILLACLLFIPFGVWAKGLIGHLSGIPYVRGFEVETLHDPRDVLLALGDGMAFAALARDPSLSNLNAFRGDRNEAALRSERPLEPYIGWILSGGDPHRARSAIVVATLLGAGFAVAATSELLRQRGRSPWFALLLLLLPGSLASLRAFGPELMGFAFIALALVFDSQQRTWPAVLCFSLAGLSRETYLLIPLVLAIRERRYLIPHFVWLAWTAVVWFRFGAWPPTVHLAGTRLLVPPLTGLAHALSRLQFRPLTIALMTLVPVLVVAVLDRRRKDPLTRFVVAFGIFSLFLNRVIWVWWASFTRVLLPMFALALIALLGEDEHALTAERLKVDRSQLAP